MLLICEYRLFHWGVILLRYSATLILVEAEDVGWKLKPEGIYPVEFSECSKVLKEVLADFSCVCSGEDLAEVLAVVFGEDFLCLLTPTLTGFESIDADLEPILSDSNEDNWVDL